MIATNQVVFFLVNREATSRVIMIRAKYYVENVRVLSIPSELHFFLTYMTQLSLQLFNLSINESLYKRLFIYLTGAVEMLEGLVISEPL